MEALLISCDGFECGCINLKEDVFDETLYVLGRLFLPPNDHNQFTHEAFRPRQPHDGMAPCVQGQGSLRHQARANSNRDKIDDQIKVVQLHGGSNPQLLSFQPCCKSSPSLSCLLKREPWLRLQPAPKLGGLFHIHFCTCKLIRMGDEGESIPKPVGNTEPRR